MFALRKCWREKCLIFLTKQKATKKKENVLIKTKKMKRSNENKKFNPIFVCCSGLTEYLMYLVAGVTNVYEKNGYICCIVISICLHEEWIMQ